MLNPFAIPRDDRGEKIRVVRTSQLRRLRPGGRPLPRDLVLRLRAATKGAKQSLSSPVPWAVSLPLSVAWLVGFVVVSVLVSTLRWPGGILLTYLVGGAIAASWIATLAARRTVARLIGPTIVAEGLCPVCLYSFEGASPVADGCIVCSECGSAWRASRVVRPYWRDDAGVPGAMPGFFARLIGIIPPAYVRVSHDAVGRIVLVTDTRLRVLGRAFANRVGTARRRQLRRRLRRIGLVRRGVVSFGSAGLSVLGVWGAWAAHAGGEPIGVWFAGFVAGIFALLALVSWLSHMFVAPRRVAGVMVENGLCPVCGTDLETDPDSPKGRLNCPGCRAVWDSATNERKKPR